MTEEELIEGLIHQRREAISHLVRTWQKKVIRTARHFLENNEDAEDLSQEVFIEILKSVGKYKRNASLNTWICRITINRSLDHLRKQKRRAVFQVMGNYLQGNRGGDHGHDHEPETMDTVNETRENRKVLDAAIGSLPENQRIAFVLNKYEELPYKEIAEIMNLSLSSVESLIHRAKLGLQKKLVNYFSEYAKKTG
jgi:RNA polymerase sigma-70 factor (ECF subfamily)